MLISKGANSAKSVRAGHGKRVLRWVGLGLVSAFCLCAGVMVLGYALRRLAVAQIAELTGAKVHADSVDVNFNGRVSFSGLVIAPHQEQGHNNAILKAKSVIARFSIGSFFLLRPRVTEIQAKDFVLDARYNLKTGRWNLDGLDVKFPAGRSGKVPVVRLEKGTVRYIKVLDEEFDVVLEVPLDVNLEPAENPQDGYEFRIITAKRAYIGKSTLTGHWRQGNVTVTGSISSADVAVFERVWTVKAMAAELIYDRDKNFRLKLRVKDLLNSNNPREGAFALDRGQFLRKSGLFNSIQRFADRYRPAGRSDVQLEASGNFGHLSECRLGCKVQCKDISICDRRFPYRIEHIVGQVNMDFSDKKMTISNMYGRHGNVELAFDGWTKGTNSERQYEINVTSDNMFLDNDVYDALSSRDKKLWNAFSPSGRAAIKYHSSRDPKTGTQKTLSVKLLGAKAAYKRFAYPLKNLGGQLSFDSKNVTVTDLVSQFEGCKITINGTASAANTDRPIYRFLIEAKDVPLDTTLASALSKRHRWFYNQLEMRGLADAQIKVFTPSPGPTRYVADVRLKKASLNIPAGDTSLKKDDKRSKMGIGLSDVSARAIFTPEMIGIEKLSGLYGSSPVSLKGRIELNRDVSDSSFSLSAKAQELELQDKLIYLLPGNIEKFVSKLQPRGKVDLDTHLTKAAGQKFGDFKMVVDCLGNSIELPISSDEPAYPLKNITGRLTIGKDKINLQNITASPEGDIQEKIKKSTIKMTGEITLCDGSLSKGKFRLQGRDVPLSKRLGKALPCGIREPYLNLSAAGRVDLDFNSIDISRSNDGQSRVEFGGVVGLKDCNFDIYPAVTELDGQLRIKGLSQPGKGFVKGRAVLSADRFRIKGKALKHLKADIYYNPSRQCWLSRKLIADCYGGGLNGKFKLEHSEGSAPQYQMQVGFEDVDLNELLSDGKGKEGTAGERTSGRISGSLSIVGRLCNAADGDVERTNMTGDRHCRIGRCRLIITDMRVGKLSPLAKLLYVLKLTRPKDFAFDRMVVDSYLQDSRILLKRIDLSGQAVAFTGSGWMDLKSDRINLILFARGRRLAEAEPSIFQSLTESLGSAVVRIEVTGDINDPTIRTKTLPVIKEALKILGTRQSTEKP